MDTLVFVQNIVHSRYFVCLCWHSNGGLDNSLFVCVFFFCVLLRCRAILANSEAKTKRIACNTHIISSQDVNTHTIYLILFAISCLYALKCKCILCGARPYEIESQQAERIMSGSFSVTNIITHNSRFDLVCCSFVYCRPYCVR